MLPDTILWNNIPDHSIFPTLLCKYIIWDWSSLDIINLDVPTQSTVTSLGIISDNPAVVESPYGYLLLRYADDNQGTGITTDPTGKTHFGLQASSTLTVDDNPADYTWLDTAGTLGVTSNLWARISGFTVEFNFSSHQRLKH